MQMCSKQEYYDAFSNTIDQGVKCNIKFSAYIVIHQQAHQDFIQLGGTIPENKNVRDFLQGITDPECSKIKLRILSNPDFLNNSAQTINIMASAYAMITKNTKFRTDLKIKYRRLRMRQHPRKRKQRSWQVSTR